MRRLVFLLVIGFVLKCSAEDLPLYRPALIGKSPEAIINRIDENLLLRAGQKDAAVMFSAGVEKTGELKWSGTYRRSEEHTSELQSRGHLVCRLLLEKKKKQ